MWPCVCVYNYHKRSHPTHVAMINCFDYGHATYLDVRQDMDACREKPEQACPIWEANRRRGLWHSADLLHFQQLVKRNSTRNANEKTVETPQKKTRTSCSSTTKPNICPNCPGGIWATIEWLPGTKEQQLVAAARQQDTLTKNKPN